MNAAGKPNFINKTILSTALSVALGLAGTGTSQADIYEFSFDNGGCVSDPGPGTTCTGQGDAVFTMLDPGSNLFRNKAYPYYGDPSWSYGFRTQIGGSVTIDETLGAGTIAINPFDFVPASGAAVAHDITIQDIGDGGLGASSTLWLGNMLFDWSGNNNIPVSIVWDFQGVLGALSSLNINDIPAVGNVVSGVGAVPGSNDLTAKGAGDITIGPAPIATTTYNTSIVAGTVLGTNPSGEEPISADTISGSPMPTAPFAGFYANFDFSKLTLSGYNDTTAPVLSLGTSSVVITVGDSFDVSNPGFAITCADNADGSDDITNPVGTNPDVSFVISGDTVDVNLPATYTVTYTCSDNAVARTALTDDPGNPGTPTTPANNTSTANLTVTVNTIPEANPNYDQTLPSDGTLDIDFTTTDLTGGDFIATDADGNTMTFSSVGTTTNGGTVTGNGTGTLTYTPLAGYNGPDSFDYTVNDGYIDSGTGTVNLTVTNVLPVAVIDGSSAVVDELKAINVVANDTDYEDDINGVTLTTVTIVDDPTYGSISSVSGGTVNYQAPSAIPPGDGKDSFTYTVTDSDGGVSTPKKTVTVSILAAPNTDPVAVDVAYDTDAGTPLVIDFTTAPVPATDADVGDTLIFTSVSAASNGTITGQNTDTLTYTPDAGYNGVDSFTFTATDDKGGISEVKIATITVNQVAPVANDDPGYAMLLGSTLNIDVAANDSDVEDDANTTALVTVSPGTPDNGGTAVAVIPADGTIDFTPTTVGTETFTYTVADSDGNPSSPAMVTVTVTAAPVTFDVPGLSTNEDTPLTTISLPDPAIATDADGDALTFDSFSQGTNGTVSANAGSTALTYTPNTNYNGTDSFSFSVSDGVNSSASKTMTVSVIAVDDPMVCQNASVTTAVDTPIVITENSLIGTCTDVDGTVTLAGYGQPTNGTVTDDGAGNLTYTPNTGFNGTDSFIFTATDGAGGDTDYSVNVTVSDAAAAAVHIISGSNFTMLTADGSLVGGATDVTGVFDERLICDTVSCTDIAMTTPLASSQTFFALPWTAHDIRVFSPGTYTFDTTCSATEIASGTTNCGGSAPLSMTVADDQLGGHMLFDYGAPSATPCGVANCDIDVAVVWDYNVAFGSPIENEADTTHTGTRQWNWASVDGDSDGIRGVAMVDGPFGGFSANFNLDMVSGYTPPVANDDYVGAKPSVLSVFDIVANDVDAEEGAPPTGITVTLSTATSLEGGTLVNNGDGTVDYTPPASLIIGDSDSFQYTLTDAGGAVSEIATVNITITDNTAPTANNVEFTVEEDAVLEISSNDIDITSTAVGDDLDGDPLTFATFDTVSTQGATVAIGNTADMLNYLPLADFNGTDTFNFTLTDGVSDSNVATMTITVNPVNDAVVCADVSLGTDIDTPLVIDATADLLAGCTDVDGDTISFVSADQPTEAGNTVEVNAGTLTYTPATDFEGDDSFTFTATDGNGGSVTATVNIKVGTPFGNFTMLDSAGNVFGGTNDIFFTWDQTTFNTDESDTNFGVMTITSVTPQPFFNFLWTAHHIRVYGPGTYSFDTSCSSSADYDAATPVTDCGGTNPITMTVGPGQIGAHILFDWGKPTTDTTCGVANCDIDVVNVWDQNAAWDRLGNTGTANKLFLGAAGVAPEEDAIWLLVSTDVNGDTYNGSPMVDGPFQGFYANFNAFAILPPGSTPGSVNNVFVEPVPNSQQETKLGSKPLASLNLYALLTILLTLFGLRLARKR